MEDLVLNHDPAVVYVLITLFMMSTGAGFPLPEEVFIILAGVASSQGALNPGIALVALLVGALVGDCIMYWVGYHFGRSVVREHRWWSRFITPQREVQMEKMISRHGLKVLFVARFLVGLRSPVYLTTGILRVPFRRFLLFDLLCATVVIGTFFTLSYRYGQSIYEWIRWAEGRFTLVVLVIVAIVALRFWLKHRRRKTKADAATDEADDENDDPSEEEKDQLENVA